MIKRRKKKASEFDKRYADNWPQRRQLAIQTVKGWCCFCLIKRCVEVHHAVYKDELGPIAGREVVGLHIFPVCEICHKILHTLEHWFTCTVDPVLNNQNYLPTIKRLRDGYLVLKQSSIDAISL